ncbi:MAG: hypothetical protein SF069_03875 [Phycisphaerae bacterium]|nr:hypothetical protein [Phycisphaerae bacterium]
MLTRKPARLFGAALAAASGAAIAHAQLNQNFNTVTETGGATVLSGGGFNEVSGWDNGITGEGAFAGTFGPIQLLATAFGDVNAGTSGSGAGVLSVGGITFDLLGQTFSAVTGVGGGPFLVGNGAPNTFNFTNNWDTGITGEAAFGGTANGAVLVGNMAIAGLPTGGNGGTGGARLSVSNVNLSTGTWFAGSQWDVPAFPGAPILQNPGFDSGGASLTGWTISSAGFNVLAEAAPVNSGTGSCKMFGRFTGSANESSVSQSLAAQPGQIWEIDCFSQHVAGDSLVGGTNSLVMRIDFLNSVGTVLATQSQTILNTASPTNVWIDNAPLQLTAPAGTVQARAVFAFLQPSGTQGGAGFVDDCRMRVVGGPPAVNLAQFTLRADVRGIVNSGAGENLSFVQIRIEDPDGDRLRFNAFATSGWQTIGGALNTAEEADATGNPAFGVFDTNASSYRVVVAFNNDSNGWGTGGTLDIDNVRLSNLAGGGGSWFAGMTFEGLTAPPGATGLDDIELSADILGSRNGGEYELRVEAFSEFQAGLDEDFNGVTGTGGGLFFDQASIIGGATQNFIPSFDAGAVGGAFGGIFGNAEFFSGGGVSARGLTTGGPDNSGNAEIRVENVIFGPGGGWFAGLTWPNQGLASQDLSQVVLSANVRGLTASGGTLGDYELRIEDQQGDRLYFQVTANGSWQSVGGTLDTAVEGGAAGGGGDGNFDLDSPVYAVTLSFVDAQNGWQFGGVLQIDNLFLTPVTVRNELGRRTFTGVANGSTFQPIGGLLSSAIGSLGDYEQNFSTATGTGGGPINGGNWDDGIDLEGEFFGTFGNAVVNGGATAEACATCGVSGSQAGRITVTNVVPNAGGWFAGVFFTPVSTSLAGGLASVQLRANIRGETNGAGSALGTYFLRLEDDNGDILFFEVTANGAFQAVGGPLSTATQGTIPGQGDGTFNLNLSAYTVTIGAVGTGTNWGTGMRLTIDDVFLTGVSLASVDSFTVVAAYRNEAATWPTGGNLVVDNLFFGPALSFAPGDMNCDGFVTVGDIGGFVLSLTNPAQYAIQFPDCDITLADVNGDGFVTVGDIGSFVALLTGA